MSHVGKPFLAYAQRTWSLDDGRPLHAETGLLAMPRPTQVELVVAHPTGVVEVSEGSSGPRRSSCRRRRSAGTATAKEVTAVMRHITVDGDRLGYDPRHGRRRRRASAATSMQAPRVATRATAVGQPRTGRERSRTGRMRSRRDPDEDGSPMKTVGVVMGSASDAR